MSENIIKPVVVAKPKIIIKSKKKKSRKGLIFGIIFLLIAATTSYILLKPKKDEGISIETEKISKRTVLQTVTATGIIDPDLQLKVTSEVSGEIIFLGVKEGDFVHKGQVIIKVNPQSFSAERDQAEAQVSSSLARVAQSEASLLRAIQEQTRIQGLYEKKLATTRELEITQSQVKICLLYTSDAADERSSVDLGGRRIIKKKKKVNIVV